MENITASPIVVGDGSNLDALAERSRDYQDDYRMVVRRSLELEAKLSAQLHPDIWNLVQELLEKRNSVDGAYQDMLVAELTRHLPGISPALILVWEHVRGISPANVGHCCMGNGSFEPGAPGQDDDDGD